MENTLRILFDFQKLQGNERLAKLISECGSGARQLSLEELEFVNAAGDIYCENESWKKPFPANGRIELVP